MLPMILFTIADEDDQAFFLRFFRQYERLMFSVAKQFSIPNTEPEDVVQESLSKLIKKLKTFRSLPKPKQINYLTTTIYHTGCEMYAKAKKVTLLSLDDARMFPAGSEEHSEPLEDTVLNRTKLEEFRRVWEELPLGTRLLLERKYVLKQSDREIAEDIGIQPASLRMRLTRAKREARELLRRSHVFGDYCPPENR